MIENYGGIIKLNRTQEKLTLKYIKHKTGISKGQLSRIENNKEKISIENIKKIFDAMEIGFTEHDLNQQFEEDFKKFYLDIVYLRDYHVSYEKIQFYKEYIRSSFSYVKYILANMIYDTMTNPKDIHKKYAFIEGYFNYLDGYQIQLYYDYLGTYYYCQGKYAQALEFFDNSLKYIGTPFSEAMLYLHMSSTQIFYGHISEALENSEKARNIFAQTNNFKRLVSVNFNVARIYSKNSNFKESEIMNLSCIQAFNELGLMNDVAKTYNNLLWNYIRSGEYEKVLIYSYEALETGIFNHCIYFYMAFSSYKLKDIKHAKEYIRLAKESLNQPTQYMKTMIHAFYIYISDADIERKEINLIKAFDVAKRTFDYELKIFSLELLLDFYTINNNESKQLSFLKQLNGYYKNIK